MHLPLFRISCVSVSFSPRWDIFSWRKLLHRILNTSREMDSYKEMVPHLRARADETGQRDGWGINVPRCWIQTWVGLPAMAPPSFVVLASPPLSLTNDVTKIKFISAHSAHTISSCYRCRFCLLSHSCPKSFREDFHWMRCTYLIGSHILLKPTPQMENVFIIPENSLRSFPNLLSALRGNGCLENFLW